MKALIEASYQDAVALFQQADDSQRLPCRRFCHFERNNWYLRDRDGRPMGTVELARQKVHISNIQKAGFCGVVEPSPTTPG